MSRSSASQQAAPWLLFRLLNWSASISSSAPSSGIAPAARPFALGHLHEVAAVVRAGEFVLGGVDAVALARRVQLEHQAQQPGRQKGRQHQRHGAGHQQRQRLGPLADAAAPPPASAPARPAPAAHSGPPARARSPGAAPAPCSGASSGVRRRDRTWVNDGAIWHASVAPRFDHKARGASPRPDGRRDFPPQRPWRRRRIDSRPCPKKTPAARPSRRARCPACCPSSVPTAAGWRWPCCSWCWRR